MNTGVQCEIDPQCRHPAPAETRICHEHRRQMRQSPMRQSPSAAERIIVRVLALLADREAGS